MPLFELGEPILPVQTPSLPPQVANILRGLAAELGQCMSPSNEERDPQ